MSQINVDVINPYFAEGNITLNGTEVRYNPDGTIIGIGTNALVSATGINNLAIGKSALQSVTTGDDNIAIGNGALSSCTGTNNTAIGRNAGYNLTTGTNNVVIGHAATGSSDTVENEITLGNSSNSVLRCAVTSITSLSDGRDKTNVEESTYGLDFIDLLKPVTFEWDTRDGVKKGVKDLGFIAQDLKEVDDEYLGLVYSENPDKLEATYGRLIPVLVKAIQELTAKINALENKNL